MCVSVDELTRQQKWLPDHHQRQVVHCDGRNTPGEERVADGPPRMHGREAQRPNRKRQVRVQRPRL